ncbi:hypothetical protein LNQ52_29575 [Klebsiella pneumoniae subsp. pneumoniae]|nr:hypothetical protein [Klebsiella pneumoniae subsp. pneumoniae]
MSLPAGRLFLAAYLFVMIVFLASHMDAVAYTMAATRVPTTCAKARDPDRGMRAVLVRGDHPHPAVDSVYRRFA